MALERCYALRCDSCGELFTESHSIHIAWYDTPRHARADAKRHGWARIKVNYPETWHDGTVNDNLIGRDYCPTCADKQEDAG